MTSRTVSIWREVLVDVDHHIGPARHGTTNGKCTVLTNKERAAAREKKKLHDICHVAGIAFCMQRRGK